ncbi:hypothetical protein [Microlunatus ginsengisoli]|uniref:Chlorite dismutase n=1 Tax=Microlunatus ginsengisoli TaxID=363863 RepID=A0ABP7AUJ4_9ACTN
MLVGTVYTIADPALWRNALAEAEQSGELEPPGLTLLVSVHSATGDYAFDLWRAESVDVVREQLDPMTVGLSTNAYFPVDESHPATLLPPDPQASVGG